MGTPGIRIPRLLPAASYPSDALSDHLTAVGKGPFGLTWPQYDPEAYKTLRTSLINFGKTIYPRNVRAARALQQQEQAGPVVKVWGAGDASAQDAEEEEEEEEEEEPEDVVKKKSGGKTERGRGTKQTRGESDGESSDEFSSKRLKGSEGSRTLLPRAAKTAGLKGVSSPTKAAGMTKVQSRPKPKLKGAAVQSSQQTGSANTSTQRHVPAVPSAGVDTLGRSGVSIPTDQVSSSPSSVIAPAAPASSTTSIAESNIMPPAASPRRVDIVHTPLADSSIDMTAALGARTCNFL
ncbi:hypothetical protein K435DRAFT_802452 [Dendrothele bispora CBS 962.96]|uniref:Uncharacterized protein n=1 Tax=Dendrothele bispora (strain CBS 962.96) TaxID=1314807 RepID=A0A4S8LLE8_DENBC|nr:hypothetical protein K435DRAFT_802452 [Dendrothele bispora CBS 962.96]